MNIITNAFWFCAKNALTNLLSLTYAKWSCCIQNAPNQIAANKDGLENKMPHSMMLMSKTKWRRFDFAVCSTIGKHEMNAHVLKITIKIWNAYAMQNYIDALNIRTIRTKMRSAKSMQEWGGCLPFNNLIIARNCVHNGWCAIKLL